MHCLEIEKAMQSMLCAGTVDLINAEEKDDEEHLEGFHLDRVILQPKRNGPKTLLSKAVEMMIALRAGLR